VRSSSKSGVFAALERVEVFMLRLNKGLALTSAVLFSCALVNCASSTNGGGSGGTSQGTGGTSQGTGGTSQGTGGSSGSAGAMSTGGSAGAMSTGGSAGSTSTGGSAGAGGSCSKPGTLHTTTIYCPFSSPDGGNNAYCTPGTEHCCEGTSSGQVSVCDPTATACPSGWTDWVCQKDSDCGNGMQCCSTGAFVMNTNTQCANYATGFHGTQCETTCATGEIHMCASSSDCGSGTCTPFSTKGAQVGACE
jgi:hypothetical protein